MKRAFVFLIAFTALSTVKAQPADTVKQIDALFAHWNNATPGGAVLVSRDNKVIYHKAFGLADLEHNTLNTTETIFESGSVAKQFTAAAIFLLASEDKLALQDDVRKYIPELPLYNTTITIQHLLHHTSGLKDWGVIGALSGWPRTTRVYTQDLALQIICKQKSLNFTPGSEYSYSNSNYSLLVTIVERVSNQSFANFTQVRFFEPLGMNHTQWRDNFREVISNRAIAYSKSDDGYQQNMPFENVHGHGGLLTTTTDLHTWNQLLETHSIGGDRVFHWRIQKGKLTNGQAISYAGGLFINTFNTFTEISHSGFTAGYRAWLAYYPQKKLSVTILSNDGAFAPAQAGQGIAEIFLGKPEAKIKTSAFITLTETEQRRWPGIYRSIKGFDVFNLEYKNNNLISDGYTLHAIHKDTLYREGLKWILSGPTSIHLQNPFDPGREYVKVNPPETNPKLLQTLNGKYYSEEADVVYEVEVKGYEVRIHNKPQPSFKLNPSFRDGFRSEDYGLYEFKRNKKGDVTGFEVSMQRAERIPFTKMK